MKGIYQGAKEITLLKEGTNKKGQAWFLYGTNLEVSGETFGLAAFSKSELEEKIKKLKPGMQIEFETTEKGGYKNVQQDTEIKIVAEAIANYAPPAKPMQPIAVQAQVKKPTIAFMTDDEVFKLMDSCIKAVNDSLSKQNIVVQSLEETTTMINSVFIACREERKGARRWE